MFWRTLLLSLMSLAAFAQSAVEILSRVDLAEAQQAAFRAKQTYLEEQQNWRLDSDGQRIPNSGRSKTFVVRFRNGERYRELVARNGVALDPTEQRILEEQSKPLTTSPSAALASLANSHRLSYYAQNGGPIVLEATPLSGEGKRHLLLIDAQTHLMLEHTMEQIGTETEMKAGSIVRSRFALASEGKSVLTSVEVEFITQLADGQLYRGLQVTNYTQHRFVPQS